MEVIGENWKLETCLKRYQGFNQDYLEELYLLLELMSWAEFAMSAVVI